MPKLSSLALREFKMMIRNSSAEFVDCHLMASSAMSGGRKMELQIGTNSVSPLMGMDFTKKFSTMFSVLWTWRVVVLKAMDVFSS